MAWTETCLLAVDRAQEPYVQPPATLIAGTHFPFNNFGIPFPIRTLRHLCSYFYHITKQKSGDLYKSVYFIPSSKFIAKLC
jgi:hypothetical protein